MATNLKYFTEKIHNYSIVNDYVVEIILPLL